MARQKKETAQVNIRLEKDLLSDISIVSKFLGLHPAEWVRAKLADDVQQAKLKIMEDARRLQIAGALSEEEFAKFSKQFKASILKKEQS